MSIKTRIDKIEQLLSKEEEGDNILYVEKDETEEEAKNRAGIKTDPKIIYKSNIPTPANWPKE